MSVALTDQMFPLAVTLQHKIQAAQASIGIKDVYYGDQDRIPRTPAVCIEPGSKERTLNGAPRRTLVNITIYVIIYHYQISNTETVRANNDIVSDQIEALLHQDPFIQNSVGEDQVIDSLVTRVESGYQQKKNSLFRASILTVEMTTQVQLPIGVQNG